MLDQFMTFAQWTYCANVVKRWGDILVEAELDLDIYVQVENRLLQALVKELRVWDGTYYPLHPAEMQLTILQDSTLAVQIRFCRLLYIWERWVPPGAWDRDSRLPSRSIGIPPEVSDDEQLYWHETQLIKIFHDIIWFRRLLKQTGPSTPRQILNRIGKRCSRVFRTIMEWSLLRCPVADHASKLDPLLSLLVHYPCLPR